MKYINYLTELYPEYKWNWHHLLIAGEIDKWLDGKTNNKLMIFAPPRSSKSTLTSMTLPAYIQEHYNNDAVMTITYNHGMSEYLQRYLKKIQIERRLPYGRQKFGGAGVQFTGCHIDIGIIDDINMFNESDSDRNNHLYWYNSMFRTRLSSLESKQLIICSSTPGCLAKRILDQDKIFNRKWTIVRIKYEHEPIVVSSDEMEVTYWPNRAFFLNKNELSNFNWKTLYQQELL